MRDVAEQACTLLGIPVEQIDQSDALEREVQLGATIGVADSADLRGDLGEEA